MYKEMDIESSAKSKPLFKSWITTAPHSQLFQSISKKTYTSIFRWQRRTVQTEWARKQLYL